jgi:hypothetical protein
MQKPINERFIKISSKLPVKVPIELGDDVTATIEKQAFVLNCVKLDQLDNQDGTIDVFYILKYLGE